MLQSNQPYQKVEDTLWEGLGIGVGSGLSAAALGHGISYATRERALGLAAEGKEASNLTASAGRQHARFYGSGLRKGLTYGAAIAGGSLLGLAGDYYFDSKKR